MFKEAEPLRKAVIYSVLAVALGLALVLLPLLALSEIDPKNQLSFAEAVPSKLRQVENLTAGGSPSSREIETLGLSFLIAFAAYGFLRTRRSRSERKVYRPLPPY